MVQRHADQHGTFHVTTITRGRIPWCVRPHVPEILIDNLCMTRNLYAATVFAFCILPDHMHIVLNPGPKGISRFMHSFKMHAARDVCAIVSANPQTPSAAIHESRLHNDGSLTLRNSVIRWQKGFHCRRIHTERQRHTVMTYVQFNPIHHNLVDDIVDWPWSSIHFPHLLDETEIML